MPSGNLNMYPASVDYGKPETDVVESYGNTILVRRRDHQVELAVLGYERSATIALSFEAINELRAALKKAAKAANKGVRCCG